jgi:hypothetical protein
VDELRERDIEVPMSLFQKPRRFDGDVEVPTSLFQKPRRFDGNNA